METHALNLLTRCLRYDPTERDTCEQLLAHPYFHGFTKWFEAENKRAARLDQEQRQQDAEAYLAKKQPERAAREREHQKQKQREKEEKEERERQQQERNQREREQRQRDQKERERREREQRERDQRERDQRERDQREREQAREKRTTSRAASRAESRAYAGTGEYDYDLPGAGSSSSPADREARDATANHGRDFLPAPERAPSHAGGRRGSKALKASKEQKKKMREARANGTTTTTTTNGFTAGPDLSGLPSLPKPSRANRLTAFPQLSVDGNEGVSTDGEESEGVATFSSQSRAPAASPVHFEEPSRGVYTWELPLNNNSSDKESSPGHGRKADGGKPKQDHFYPSIPNGSLGLGSSRTKQTLGAFPKMSGDGGLVKPHTSHGRRAGGKPPPSKHLPFGKPTGRHDQHGDLPYAKKASPAKNFYMYSQQPYRAPAHGQQNSRFGLVGLGHGNPKGEWGQPADVFGDQNNSLRVGGRAAASEAHRARTPSYDNHQSFAFPKKARKKTQASNYGRQARHPRDF